MKSLSSSSAVISGHPSEDTDFLMRHCSFWILLVVPDKVLLGG